MRTVFLSASFPVETRKSESGAYYPADIAAAAASTIEAILRTGNRLLFGGHPTISPIVLAIAGRINAGSQVTIYQSEFFRRQLTSEVERLVRQEGATMVFTPVGTDLPESLKTLRNRMLGEPVDLAFFVGGMSGLREELKILRNHHPEVECLAFVTPGGYAARLTEFSERPHQPLGDGKPLKALHGRAYGSLALRALSRFEIGEPLSTDEL